MRSEIMMEGVFLDLLEDFSAEITAEIDDIREFGTKNTAYSKTIEIPGTPNNNRVFGFIFEMGVQSLTFDPTVKNIGINFTAGKSAAALVLVDSVQVLKGVLRLMEIKMRNGAIVYECCVTGELGGLIAALGTKKMRGNTTTTDDLTVGHLHQWTVGNIQPSWATAGAGSGYAYPLIDYGAVSTNKHDFDIRALRPAVYVKELWDKMFAAAGYTYNSAFLNSAFFKRLVIPNADDKLYIETNALVYAARVANMAVSTVATNITFDPSLSHLYNSTFTVGNTTVNYTGPAISAQFQGTIFYHYDNTVPLASFEIELRRNGVNVYTATVPLLVTTATLSGQVQLGVNVPSISIASGDNFTFRVRVSSIGAFVTVEQAYMTITADAVQTVGANVGDMVSPDGAIPRNTTQKDFLGTILKMFNLYIVEDKEQPKKLNIEPYVNFYDPQTPLDWTNKLDYSQDMSIKPMSELNARFYGFNYTDDSDYWNEYYKNKYQQGYGNYTFDSQFEFADNKKEVKIIFAGSPLLGYTGQDKFFPAIYKRDSAGVESGTASKPRILQVKRVSPVSLWSIKNGATLLGTVVDYCYGGHLNDPQTPTSDLNFGAPAEALFPLSVPYPSANLFNAYYSPYMAEIVSKDSKLLTASFLLSPIDMANLNFRKLIKVEGVLYRLNKIVDYGVGADKTTKVELLKVIELFY